MVTKRNIYNMGDLGITFGLESVTVKIIITKYRKIISLGYVIL